MSGKSITIKDYAKEIPGKLADEYTWKFPDITTKNTLGNTLSWTILVRVIATENRDPKSYTDADWIIIEPKWFESGPLGDEYSAYTCVQSGQVTDGVTNIREIVPTITSIGKNIGRSNATNVFTQALRDALSDYNDQLRKCTTDNPNFLPPMLAQTVSTQKKLVISKENPAYMQPKFDGGRCVSVLVDTWCTYSRTKLEFPGFQYVRDELNQKVTREMLSVDTTYGPQVITHLDGEIFLHGLSLQIISGLMRRAHKQDDPELQYHIYDCVLEDRSAVYHVRKAALDVLFNEVLDECKYIKSVPTVKITNINDSGTYYKSWLEQKYEGAMLRLDHKYEFSYNEHHSKSLLKLKPTFDHEYKLVSYHVADKGKAKGALMVTCKVVNNTGVKNFNVTPKMELPERIALAKKMATIEANGQSHFINHWYDRDLIVYYDELSTSLVPQRARTKMEIRTIP